MNSLIAWIRQRLVGVDPAIAGDALRAALAEQDRLTRDTHHQVQNSLQIVSSMIALQVNDSDSPELRRIHGVIQSQIQTLTLVQRWMNDRGPDGVDFAGMLAELCAGLEASLHSQAHPQAQIACTVPACSLHPDHATPVGFLITELVLIAARHSPPGLLALSVAVTAAAGMIEIRLATAGFAGTDLVAAAGGQAAGRIIMAMTRQLDGSLQHDAAAGIYLLRFAASSP